MTRPWLAVAALAGAALAGTARADVWERASETGRDAAVERYDAAMRLGDEAAQKANARSLQSVRVINQLVDEAISGYTLAANTLPDRAEPYFRIAMVIDSFYTNCDATVRTPRPTPATCPGRGRPIDVAHAEQELAAWDEFEKRAPLDPRIGDALFERAILRTKLVTAGKDAKLHLEGALVDYKALIERADGLTLVQLRLAEVWGNLAETYMMLGKLDEAIDAYQLAIDKGGTVSTYYGKAVALDRDERPSEALDLIRRQGAQAFDEYKDDVRSGAVFYVPAGEEHYYFALIDEAFGYDREAVDEWKAFIKSGAHPQYHARAQAHITALGPKVAKEPRPPRPQMDPFDLYP